MISTVLILAQTQDTHSNQLCAELEKLGARVCRFNSDTILSIDIEFMDGKFCFRWEDNILNLNEVQSVFIRKRPTARDFGAEDFNSECDEKEYIGSQKEYLFQEAFFRLHQTARMYNSFAAQTQFSGKLNQDFIARQVGLAVSPTLVSSDREKIRNFVDVAIEKNKKICTKPTSPKFLKSNGEILSRYTEFLPENFDIDIEDFRSCPIIFQNYVEKDYEIRATVIDSNVMAVKIDSQAAPGETKIDWRKYNVPQTPHSRYFLPDTIAKKLIDFNHIAGLNFSAFDLIRSKNGEYVFLETNPSGQWLWLENLTGYEITRGIAEALLASGP